MKFAAGISNKVDDYEQSCVTMTNTECHDKWQLYRHDVCADN